MKEKVDFKHLAKVFMFDPCNASNMIINLGLQFRKGKNFNDISKALLKAAKNGRNKTEYELGMFEIYLKDVFKINRKDRK